MVRCARGNLASSGCILYYTTRGLCRTNGGEKNSSNACVDRQTRCISQGNSRNFMRVLLAGHGFAWNTQTPGSLLPAEGRGGGEEGRRAAICQKATAFQVAWACLPTFPERTLCGTEASKRRSRGNQGGGGGKKSEKGGGSGEKHGRESYGDRPDRDKGRKRTRPDRSTASFSPMRELPVKSVLRGLAWSSTSFMTVPLPFMKSASCLGMPQSCSRRRKASATMLTLRPGAPPVGRR